MDSNQDFKLDEVEEKRRGGLYKLARALHLPRKMLEDAASWKRTRAAMITIITFVTVVPAAAVTISKKATPIEGIQLASLPSGAKSQPVSFNSNQQQANQQSAFRVAFNELVRETSGRLFEFKFNEKENKLYATPLHVTAAYLNKDIPEFYQVSSMTGGITLGGVGASMNMGSLYNEENFKCNQNPPDSPKFKHCRSRLMAIQLDTLARQANIVLSFVDTKESLARNEKLEEEPYNAGARASLHNIYLACKAYWGDNGSNSLCSLEVARGPIYEFIESNNVVVTALPATEKSFVATAKHAGSSITFKISADGEITNIS